MTAGGSQPSGTVLPPPEVCRLLQRRLRRETQGAALFDLASRGRYATDASIYQILPVGAFIPADEQDISIALDIARDLNVPVIARGGGTSQCGQTIGAALVIDNSKHFRRVLDIDVERRTAVVEPGAVLDELNAQLKPHGLWFPVDVSTSAQATLGGMAGNNSCGSRSIAYGNMVHNVLGVRAWLSRRRAASISDRVSSLSGRAAQIAQFVRELAARHRDEIERALAQGDAPGGRLQLGHLRQSERTSLPAAASVNLAHLLVGSEGTLAYTQQFDVAVVAVAPPPRVGRRQFSDFPRLHAGGAAHGRTWRRARWS